MSVLAFGSNETYQFDREWYLAAGMRYTRTTLSWALCEPVDGGGISFAVSPDVTIDPTTYIEIVAQATADGVMVILTITDPPAWASGAGLNQIDPAYYGRFQTFCQAAVVQFGTNAIYEPFNEVTDTGHYWDESDYPDVLSYAAAGIRAGNPDARIMHAGLVAADSVPAQDLLKTLCQGVNKANWDICSFHIYGAESSVTPSTLIYRGILKAHDLQNRPLWITESASGTKDGSVVATPEHAASDVVKRALDGFAHGASLFLWWPISDAYLGSDNPAGLNPTTKCLGLCWCPPKVELDLGVPYVSHPRISHTAFATMTRKIAGFTGYRELARTVRQVIVNGHLLWVAWAGTGAMPTFRGMIRVTDYVGTETVMDASSLVLTDRPVYIELVRPVLTIPSGRFGEGIVASDTDIANIALAMLGKARIAAMSENDTISDVFPSIRDAVLSDHPWQFATFYADLSEDAAGTPSTWSHSFHLPTDPVFMAAQEVNGNAWMPDEPSSKFEVAGGRVLTNDSAVVLKYTARVTDSSLYDPMFVMALASALAAYVAPNLAPTLAAVADRKYAEWMQKARSRDAQQGTMMIQRNTRFRDARL